MLIDKYKELGIAPAVYKFGEQIERELKERFDAYFAEPQYSSDNACGIAILASICDKKE